VVKIFTADRTGGSPLAGVSQPDQVKLPFLPQLNLFGNRKAKKTA
jgi:hypothetical protein